MDKVIPSIPKPKGKSTNKSTFASFRRQKSFTSAEASFKNKWNSEGVELGEEANENLINAFPMAPSMNPHIQLDTTAASQSDSKMKILIDLLNTERTYFFDLETWEGCIQQSAELSAEDKRALTNGYSVLKQLSQSLTDSLSTQKSMLENV